MKKAFTVIELLVVITIIGIIVGFVVPNFNNKKTLFNSTYRNVVDELILSRQRAITTANPNSVFVHVDKIVSNGIDFNLPSGMTVSATNGINDVNPLIFNVNGSVDITTTLTIEGFGYSKDVLVTISGYILFD